MITFNNKVLNVDGKWIKKVDPLNPLNLPANTIRCRFVEGYTPTRGDTQTLVHDNIWDIYKAGSDWSYLFNERFASEETNLIAVLGANTTGVTEMSGMFYNCAALTSIALFDTSDNTWMYNMFYGCSSLASIPLFNTSNVVTMASAFTGCSSLTSVPLFDTSSNYSMSSTFSGCSSLTSIPLFDTLNVNDFRYMMYECRSLQHIPLFDTSSATNMNSMFEWCYNVQSGALALYQQASRQANPPSSHDNTFRYCGSDTTSGYAELQQIPQSWGGYKPY